MIVEMKVTGLNVSLNVLARPLMDLFFKPPSLFLSQVSVEAFRAHFYTLLQLSLDTRVPNT